MRKILIILMVAVALTSVGCKSNKKLRPDASSQSAVGSNGADSSSSSGAASAGSVGSDDEAAGPQAGILAKRVIYFDFDSSDIKGEGTDVVAAHAKYLAGHSGTRVRLEGNTDDRGSREYNIGLGERRAQSVRRALLLQGVAESQVSTVSYGAERPAVAGSDEGAWSKNRRVEIVYLAASGQPAAVQPSSRP